MTQSTDAIFAFGFDLGEEENLPENLLKALTGDEECVDVDEFICREAGLGYETHPDPNSRPEVRSKAIDDWYAARRAAVAAYPLDLVAHCHHEYRMYFLAIRSTVVTAARGCPEEIKSMGFEGAHLQALREFCAKYGIEWQDPNWYIFSDWS